MHTILTSFQLNMLV